MSYKALAKDPSNYEEHEVEKNVQVPIDISISQEIVRPTLIGIAAKKQADKRKNLENRLNENTEKMKRLKKKTCKYYGFWLVNKRNLINMSYIQLPYSCLKK